MAQALVPCKVCEGGTMKKAKAKTGGFAKTMFAFVFLIIGIVLLFLIPIGTIIGIFVILGSIGMMGRNSRKVLKCNNCGAVVDRA